MFFDFRIIQYSFFILFFFHCSSKFCYSAVNQSIETFELFILSSINKIDWKIVVLEMLNNSSFFNKINSNSTLLVNMVRNNTNSVVQTSKITNILIEVIQNNIRNCNIISIEKLYDAYRKLNVSSEEIINSYEFSIEIAHELKADYIIYSIVYEKLKTFHLELQLILPKTGEIIQILDKDLSNF